MIPPDCMMPDGGDPCKGFLETQERAFKAEEALRREKYAYDVAQEQRTHFKDRLAKAEEALREIDERINMRSISLADIRVIIRSALAQDKGSQ